VPPAKIRDASGVQKPLCGLSPAQNPAGSRTVPISLAILILILILIVIVIAPGCHRAFGWRA